MRALVCVLALAGCDRVFGLGDPYQDAGRVGMDGPMLDTADDAPLPVGPIAYFPLDETLTDSVSHATASCVGGGMCKYITPGERGTGALALDGNECVEFVIAEMPLQFTIAMWVFPGTSGQSTLFERAISTTNPSPGWKIENTQAAFILTTYGPSGIDAVSSQHGAPVGTWTHVAVTYDGMSRRIYVNGMLELTSPAGVVTPGLPTATIGCTEAMASKLTGTLDEVYVYGAALSQAEVSALYQP